MPLGLKKSSYCRIRSRRAAALSPFGAMHQVRISVRSTAIGRITRSWLDAFSAICRLGKMVRLRMLNIQSRFAAP